MSNLSEIEILISQQKLDKAQKMLSQLGPKYYKNSEYLYLRSNIFYLKKLYYLAIDTLLIALEFDQKDKIYNLIGKIYETLNNKGLSKKFLDPNLRVSAAKSLKVELSGIYTKNK